MDLPVSINKRIFAVKKIEKDMIESVIQYFKDLYALEVKYFREQYTPIFKKRASIVKGEYEPSEEESMWSSEDEDQIAAPKIDLRENGNIRGIPNFWLSVFKNVSMLKNLIKPYDEPILEYLKDVKVIVMEKSMGFVLEFLFERNQYFTNEIFTKEYHIKLDSNIENLADFNGPQIQKCIGCEINWFQGKDVTTKTVRKRQIHKTLGVTRKITKIVHKSSFFNFFSPPLEPTDPNMHEACTKSIRKFLTYDFAIPQIIKERVVPKAIVYFLGIGEDDDLYFNSVGIAKMYE